MLTSLGLRAAATLFITGTPLTAEPFAVAAARWWDLDRLEARHRKFLDRYEPQALALSTDPQQAFVTWLGCVDDWKTIPFVDPGLPAALLPEDWPGERSLAVFAAIRSACEAPARRFVAETLDRAESTSTRA